MDTAVESKKKKKKKPKKEVTYEHGNGASGRVPLRIDTQCVATDDTLLLQMKSNLERGLPEFIPLPNPHSGVMVLVGSGPSVKGELDSILAQKKKGRLIVALKGAHDFLIENGIEPDYCVMLDPQEKIVDCVRLKENRVTYLIASQCHPSVFDHLKDNYVIIWHALSGIGEHEILENKVLIGGGTTTGMRAMNIAHTLGYRKVHMYGFDSCCTEVDGKQMKRLNIHSEGGMDAPKRVIDVWVGKRRFWANPAMAAQADEFQKSLAILKGMKVHVHGDGLIREVWKHHIGKGGDAWFDED